MKIPVFATLAKVSLNTESIKG